MIQTAKPYIDHLRPPGVKFMSISAYNKKFGASVDDNPELEKALQKARKEMGPNDFIIHNFVAKKQKVVKTKAPVKKMEKEEIKEVPTEADSLDDLLSEEIEETAEVEEEYDEVCKDCKKKDCKTDHQEQDFKDKLEGMTIEDAQTLHHLIAFKGETSDIKERTMKGKARYMEKLKAYMNGDTTVEVRMYNGKRVKVSELSPNKDSLLQLFESFPSGPHIVECD